MSERGKNRSIFRQVLFALIKLAIIGMILVIGINFYVIKATEGQIGAVFDSPEDSATEEEVSELSAIEPECIMVLGASVTADGRPSSIPVSYTHLYPEHGNVYRIRQIPVISWQL